METKNLIAERKALQEEASESGQPILLQEFKIKVKEVKKAVKKDKKNYREGNLGENVSISQTWNTARDLLGSTKNLSPTSINQDGNITSSPIKRANIFNKFFQQKVKIL